MPTNRSFLILIASILSLISTSQASQNTSSTSLDLDHFLIVTSASAATLGIVSYKAGHHTTGKALMTVGALLFSPVYLNRVAALFFSPPYDRSFLENAFLATNIWGIPIALIISSLYLCKYTEREALPVALGFVGTTWLIKLAQ